MCPSYMATRDEEHSTRGRANALRAAIAGHLPNNSLTSSRMYDVMDLCLECKACKSECPSNVDMAKLKYEFLGKELFDDILNCYLEIKDVNYEDSLVIQNKLLMDLYCF